MDSILSVLGMLGGAITLSGIAVFVGNRRIKAERAEFVEKQRDDYRQALDSERAECKAQIVELTERISRLEGQLETATGELGEKLGERIGQRIGTAILTRLAEKGVG